jgi:hypothetical protein
MGEFEMLTLEDSIYTLSLESKAIVEIDPRKVKNLQYLKSYGYDFEKRYVANTDGEVFSIKWVANGKYYCYQVQPYVNRDHYVEYVIAENNGRQRHIGAHRLVAYLFIKNPRKLRDVNHKDGNRSNNKVTNLEWVSHSDNMVHSWKYMRSNPKWVKYVRKVPIGKRREFSK